MSNPFTHDYFSPEHKIDRDYVLQAPDSSSEPKKEHHFSEFLCLARGQKNGRGTSDMRAEIQIKGSASACFFVYNPRAPPRLHYGTFYTNLFLEEFTEDGRDVVIWSSA
jgi:hypothetical protein